MREISLLPYKGYPWPIQLYVPIQPQTNHNQPTPMFTRHCLSYIYIQITVYHNDHITITQPTHNTTKELLHPNIIKVAVPVSLNQHCHAASEYYGWISLYSGECGLIPLPSHTKDKTRHLTLPVAESEFVDGLMVELATKYWFSVFTSDDKKTTRRGIYSFWV